MGILAEDIGMSDAYSLEIHMHLESDERTYYIRRWLPE
jgi:hypothetical protein